ncbi:DEAD/DEAH box helicase [Mobilicoccus pelagius]|uniref:RNA polymerase sigma factor RpoH n=1 Tax=Mobilicoccus pelagius NBRC 104925 TaxID=1089455 RepID=H5URC3_9MICO|nr:DEAD/DEAH box helicase [Mobilicoccus pelagius]GAB48281.1 RNA polymerase sigma factor RpoH [Mobilicoccus pelagius NBRC 104925]
MTDVDRRAVAAEFGALAADLASLTATLTTTLTDMEARLARLERLFAADEAHEVGERAGSDAQVDVVSSESAAVEERLSSPPEGVVQSTGGRPAVEEPPVEEPPVEEPAVEDVDPGADVAPGADRRVVLEPSPAVDEPAGKGPSVESPPAPAPQISEPEVEVDESRSPGRTAGPAETPPPGSAPVAAFRAIASLPDLPEIRMPDLYPWQLDALEAWHHDGKVGVVEAVTGAGKTRVGLAAMANALIDGRRVVVIAPTQGLVTQWAAQVVEHFPGVRLSTDASRSPGWHVLIDTVHTVAGHDPLWPDEAALLVADEAHRYGAPTFAQALRPSFTQRLGLSATFERGDEGDDILRPFFRDVCFRLGYERALADGLIARFRVAQVGVPLSPPERAEYDAASAGIRRAWYVIAADLGRPTAGLAEIVAHASHLAARNDRRLAGPARTLLAAFSKRSDVLARAAAKVTALELLAPAVSTSGGTIVFTGATASALQAAETLERAGCVSAAVHGEMDQGEREERLELLRTGQTRSISAPRLLDEGVDVPDADLGIILAASKSRRQMIQRLGRVVRRKPDGRSARLVVLYALGTSEDPGVETVPAHLQEIVTHADAAATFALPRQSQEALAFLRG